MDLTVLMTLFFLTFVNAIAPGPGVLTVASVAACFGRRSAVRLVSGQLAGTFVLLVLAYLITLGTLSLAETVFIAAQWVGVFVLAFLAWLLWPKDTVRPDAGLGLEAGYFWTGAALALSQPMSLIFLLAVFPQFLGQGASNTMVATALGASVMCGTALAMGLIAAFGTALSVMLVRFQVWIAKVSATSLALFSTGIALSALGLI